MKDLTCFSYPFLVEASAANLSPSHNFSCSSVSLSLTGEGGGGGDRIGKWFQNLEVKGEILR